MPLRVVGMDRLGVICSPCLADIASHFGIDGDAVPFSEQHTQVIDAVFAHAFHLRKTGQDVIEGPVGKGMMLDERSGNVL